MPLAKRLQVSRARPDLLTRDNPEYLQGLKLEG